MDHRLQALTVMLALLLTCDAARAGGDEDLFLCVSDGTMYRVDSGTGDLSLHASGLIMPLYPWFFDDFAIVPSFTNGLLYKVDNDDGSVSLLTGGGFLASPVTFVMNPVTQRCFVSDATTNLIVEVDPSGQQQIFADNSTGLLVNPAGMAIDDDGTMYVGNLGDGSIVEIDTAGKVSLINDGQGISLGCGGVQLDGGGNLFIADFVGGNGILRLKVDTGELEVFCDDPLLVNPRDLKLRHDGTLVTTCLNASLVSVDVLGNATLVAQDSSITGFWQGVSSKLDDPKGTGRFTRYGDGTIGAGGVAPDLRGLFLPNIGTPYGIELTDVLGGTPAFLLIGVESAAIPAFGGTVHVGFTPPWVMLQFALPGSGPGGGDGILQLSVPDDPLLVDVSLFYQFLVVDPDAPRNVAMSNGLQVEFGQ